MAAEILARLSTANRQHDLKFSGDWIERQPVHTVYGGAHLFKARTGSTLGTLALKTMEAHAPNAEALGMAEVVYARVVEKLQREPVEDFRIDFEDGYGIRTDAEEDTHADQAARELVSGLTASHFPPFIGIRIKPLTEVSRQRSVRTLNLFVDTCMEANHGQLPEKFVVTLPKVSIPAQVAALAELFQDCEEKYRLPAGSMKMELMIETTESVACIPSLLDAAQGRCRGLHFGVYDYTAACGITAEHQSMSHPACDFARQMMQVSAAGRGVTLSDGATNVLPVGSAEAVRSAMRLHFDDVQRSLRIGFYQGWDLHPAQLPTRYAAVFDFFHRSLPAASVRLRNFIEKAARATLVGDVFDDAATGQGLLNFFLRGHNCGALTDEEVLAGGVTLDELRSKSFAKILENHHDRV